MARGSHGSCSAPLCNSQTPLAAPAHLPLVPPARPPPHPQSPHSWTGPRPAAPPPPGRCLRRRGRRGGQQRQAGGSCTGLTTSGAGRRCATPPSGGTGTAAQALPWRRRRGSLPACVLLSRAPAASRPGQARPGQNKPRRTWRGLQPFKHICRHDGIKELMRDVGRRQLGIHLHATTPGRGEPPGWFGTQRAMRGSCARRRAS